ncbi:MAG: SHOCT domain-containing protein, partial [Solirubrobacteraceae bacterium]
YMMGRRNAERRGQEEYQNERITGLENQPPPTAAAPPSSGGVSADAVERLKQLGQLHEQGILTDEEFSQQKQKVLAG